MCGTVVLDAQQGYKSVRLPVHHPVRPAAVAHARQLNAFSASLSCRTRASLGRRRWPTS